MGKKVIFAFIMGGLILLGVSVTGCEKSEGMKQTANSAQASPQQVVGDPAQAIRDKISEMERVSGLISGKKAQVVEAKNVYEEYKNTTILYVQSVRSALHVSTYEEAIKEPEINSNLQLVIKYTYYLKRLGEFENEFQQAEQELSYLRRDAEADLPMVKIIDKKEIGNLVAKISLVIQKHVPQVGDLVIPPPSQSDLVTASSIWNDIAPQIGAPVVQPNTDVNP